MKFLHVADLHFGKSIYGKSMLESDQPYWVDRFLELCDIEKPDAVLVAGDVYDRASPSGEAVDLLDKLITNLSFRNIHTFLIAGNHDSAQKLAFGRAILTKGNIHISGRLEKELTHVTLTDEDGPITFWLLPYLFPEQVSVLLEDNSIHSYDQAVRGILAEQKVDYSQRNVILSHQNVTVNGKEAEKGGSESAIGGVGQVDYSAFDRFDYVALGHIHSAYPVGREEVRYAGTPMCYHFDEVKQKHKGATKVEIFKKGDPLRITSCVIDPCHRLHPYKGTYSEVLEELKNAKTNNEYVSVHITDQRISPENHALFREILDKQNNMLMECVSEYNAFSLAGETAKSEDVQQMPVEELFAQLYRIQSNDEPPTDLEYDVMSYIGELVRSTDTHEPMDEKLVQKIVEYTEKKAKGDKQ